MNRSKTCPKNSNPGLAIANIKKQLCIGVSVFQEDVTLCNLIKN